MAKIMPNEAVMSDQDSNTVTDPGEAVIGTRILRRRGDRSNAGSYQRNLNKIKRPGDGQEVQVPGRLTREAMVQIINEGKSFRLPTQDDTLNALGGQLVTKVDEIPSEADLAVMFNEPETAGDVRQQNEAKIKNLQQENERLAQLDKAKASASQKK